MSNSTNTYRFYEVNNKRIMSYPPEIRLDAKEIMTMMNFPANNLDIEIGKVIEVNFNHKTIIYDIVGIEQQPNSINFINDHHYRVYVLPRISS